MTDVRIEHPDGTTDRLLSVASEVHRSMMRMTTAHLHVLRDEANEITINEGDDEVYLEDADGNDEFGGRLKNKEHGGTVVTLVVDSFERDAKEAEPTGVARRTGVADGTLISEVASDVPSLSAGTINTVDTGLDFVFAHASQAKKARVVEEATDGEIRYNADKTIDYKDRLGSDKSGSITISPGNQNLDGNINVVEKADDKRITHLRMLGAGEGKHQIEANIVPSDDTTLYNNKTTYSSSWSSGDRKVWDVYTSKDVMKLSTVKNQGLTLIKELDSEYVEVEATIRDEDIQLGDSVYVEKTKDGIDQPLRITELVRIDDSKGVRHECTLSSRLMTREASDTKDRKDVHRYNKAFEGSPVTINTGGGRQPVDGTLNYEFHVYYPAEVEYEHRVNLRVKGLAYRAYSQGTANNPDFSNTVVASETASALTIQGGTWTEIDSLIPGNDTSFMLAHVSISNLETDLMGFSVRYHDTSDGVYIPDSSGFRLTNQEQYSTDGAPFVDARNVNGNTLKIEALQNLGSPAPDALTYVSTQWMGAGLHNHDPDPGIIESFGGTTHYPGSCDVLVNGTSQGVSLGDGTGEFTGVVNLAGALNEGQWNTIEVTSNSLGNIQAHLDIDVYRQILGDG